MHTLPAIPFCYICSAVIVPSIMEIGALFEYVLPLLTSKRMHSSSFAKLTRITVAWKHFCEPDADFAVDELCT